MDFGSNNYGYCVNSSTPGTLKVTPVQSTAGKYSYGTIIHTDSYYLGSGPRGYSWSSKPSAAPCTLIRFISDGGGHMSEGNKILCNTEDGNIYVNSTSVSSPTAYDYGGYTITADNYRYFVSKSGNADVTEVYPDSTGAFVMPFTAQYFFVTCNLENLSVASGNIWTVQSEFTLSYEQPSDQNEVAAINNQTSQMMDTTGSDTVSSDAITDGVQTYEDLSLVQQVGTMLTQIQSAVNTTEQDGTIPFPGLQLSGFNIPAQTIDVWSFTPAASLQPTIRGMVTFIFCAVFLSHIIHLIQAIFGIYEYGVGVEDFGQGTYDMGPQPVKWKGDYSVDVDLGF